MPGEFWLDTVNFDNKNRAFAASRMVMLHA